MILIEMKDLLILSLFYIRTFSVIFKPEVVIIEDCGEQFTEGTLISDVIKHVAEGSKNILRNENGDAKIVMAESTGSSISKIDLCRKTDSTDSNKEYYHVKTTNVKSFLYKVGEAYKFILVGSDLNTLIKPYDIVTTESDGKIVVVDYVKCLNSAELDTFKAKYTNDTPKPYIEGATRICFVPFLMIEPILVTASGSASYSITITPFQKHDCPKCQEIQTPSTCSQN